MDIFFQLAKKAFFYARTRPAWWALAFFQLVFIVLQATYWKKAAIQPGFLALWLVVFFLLLLVSLLFWLKVQAAEETREIDWKRAALTDYFIAGLAAFVIIRLAGVIFSGWALRSLISSLSSVSFVALALGCLLLGLNLRRGFYLAIDIWRHKSLAMSLATFLLLLSHAIFFGFSRAAAMYVLHYGSFQAREFSATIWALLFLGGLAIVFCAAWLNAFLVFGFLHLSGPIKPKQPEASLVPAAAAAEAAGMGG